MQCLQARQSAPSAEGLSFEAFQEAQGDDFMDAPASPVSDGDIAPAPLPLPRSKRKASGSSSHSYEHVRVSYRLPSYWSQRPGIKHEGDNALSAVPAWHQVQGIWQRIPLR